MANESNEKNLQDSVRTVPSECSGSGGGPGDVCKDTLTSTRNGDEIEAHSCRGELKVESVHNIPFSA
jgi:hypothetical protein